MMYENKRTHGAAPNFKGGLVFIVTVLIVAMQFLPISTAQTSTSDLIVSSGDVINITGPEFGVKGSITILSGGTLNIENTLLTIYQDHDRQFELNVEDEGTINLVDSVITTSKALDISLGDGSQMIIEGSEVQIPGKLYGSPYLLRAHDSNVNVDSAEIYADNIDMKTSTVYSDIWTISSPDAVIEKTHLYSPITVVDGDIIFRGSRAENITVLQDSSVKIYQEVNLDLTDAAGVPTAGAAVTATRFDMLKPSVESHTDTTGSWSEYLLSEVVNPDGSTYNGNYRITCSLDSYEISKYISLPPIEEYTGSQDIVLSFDDVLPPTHYYDENPDDIRLSEAAEFNINTYPSSGVTTYIHEGNIYVKDSSSLIISEGSEFKVVQRDKNYRIELTGAATLSIDKDAQMASDKPLNIYLYDSSNLVIDGGTLKAGMVVAMDSSSIRVNSGDLDIDRLYFQGDTLNIQDSSLKGGPLDIKANTLNINKSTIQAEKVSIYSPTMDIVGSDFDTSLYLSSPSNEVRLVDVTAPEIVVLDNLTVHSYRYLSLQITNTHNLLVPGTDVYLYRTSGDSNELLETRYVPDGRTTFTVLSEVISSEGARFVGNYMVKAMKNGGSDEFESLETMVAVDKNVETIVKFTQHFPYSLVLEVDVPDRIYGRNESFRITGVAYYEGADLDVDNVTVQIHIGNFKNLTWETTTDADGDFDLEIRAPHLPGRYTLVVTVVDEYMDMSAQEKTTITVDGEEEVFSFRDFMFNSPLGISISIVLIMVLIVIAYIIVMWPIRRERPSLTSSSSEELVKWAENVVGRR